MKTVTVTNDVAVRIRRPETQECDVTIQTPYAMPHVQDHGNRKDGMFCGDSLSESNTVDENFACDMEQQNLLDDATGDVFFDDAQWSFPELQNSPGRFGRKLMHPRKRPKAKSQYAPNCCSMRICRFVIVLMFILFMATGITLLTISFLRKNHTQSKTSKSSNITIGCTNLEKETVWTHGIPKLMTESAFRLVDVNQDGTLDVLFGFATGAEGHYSPDYLCDIYFNSSHPCFGGVIALDGNTGKELWRHYTAHEIFSLNCGQDLDKDGVLDCLAAGRVATFEAVSGRRGSKIWAFEHTSIIQDMNFYTGQFIPDLDQDGIAEIINTHGGDPFGEPGSETRLSGKIFIISGATGHVLQWVTVPDKKECYYSPVLYTDKGGNLALLFGTGGETHGGSLWYISVHDLYKGDIHKAKPLYTDPYKGIMTPPVLLDMTGDGIQDIMFSTFNSSSLLLNGDTFELIWNFTFPGSETYSTPAAGFFNNDNIPDFMVHWQYGPGFPIYYHSVTTILDGRNGKPLISPYIRDTIGVQTSPLTISSEGQGNDLFLFFTSDCLGHEGQGGKYMFIKGTNVHEKSRSDVCHLRFQSEAVNKLHVFNRHIESPGLTLYNSINNKDEENSVWVSTTQEAIEFLEANPRHLQSYNDWKKWVAEYQNQGKQAAKSRTLVQKNSFLNSEELAVSDVSSLLSDLLKEYIAKDLNSNTNTFNLANRQAPNQNFDGSYYAKRNPYGSLLSSATTNAKGKTEQRYSRKTFNDFSNIGVVKDDTKKQSQRLLNKRHVGPHDEGGLQRLISTGTLAPTLLETSHPDYQHTMDVIFATYWFYPAKTEVILPEDQKCIDEKMTEQIIRFDPKSKYYGMDNDGYEHAITHECLQLSGHTMPEDGVYESQGAKDPYLIHMGQLTVYRVRLKCDCKGDDRLKDTSTMCSSLLPYEKQQWPAYMGRAADSRYLPRR